MVGGNVSILTSKTTRNKILFSDLEPKPFAVNVKSYTKGMNDTKRIFHKKLDQEREVVRKAGSGDYSYSNAEVIGILTNIGEHFKPEKDMEDRHKKMLAEELVKMSSEEFDELMHQRRKK